LKTISKRDPAHRHSIAVDADPGRLVEKLQNFERVDVPKWL
jgi:hypothetical protein